VFAAAVPVAAVPIPLVPGPAAAPAARPADVVAVDPSPGRRVAVLRTSDPTVTVVWLY
jgi:hypothetical protein